MLTIPLMVSLDYVWTRTIRYEADGVQEKIIRGNRGNTEHALKVFF